MSSRPVASPHPIPWDRLAQSIADGEAVLILGPDAIPLYPAGATEAMPSAEEMTFSRLSRRLIRETPEIGINFFYERDNLFLFRDEMSKKLARKTVRELGNQNPGNQPLLLRGRRIRIPHHAF